MNLSIDQPNFSKDLINILKDSGKSQNTLVNYVSQIKQLLIGFQVKRIVDLTKLSLSQWDKMLDTITNPSTRSSRLNAYISVVKLLGIPVPNSELFNDLKDKNTKMSDSKMETMKENQFKTTIPNDFDKRVNAFLEKEKGTRSAVLMAMLTKAPPVRIHSLEGVKVAYNKTAYNRMVKLAESGVLGFYSNKAILYPLNVKVKSLKPVEIEYPSEVVEQLKLYLGSNQTYLFPTGDGYLKTQSLKLNLKKAFEKADIGTVGIQLLRRIAETNIENDPTMTFKEKEAFSLKMNHSRLMGTQYVIKNVVERGTEEQEIYKQIGKEVSQFTTNLLNINQKSALELVLKAMKNVNEVAAVFVRLRPRRGNTKRA